MAIAFVLAGADTAVTGTSNTYAFDCTGADFLIVGVSVVAPATDILTSVTYNGVAMTRVAIAKPQSNVWVYMYILESPSTGSNNIVATISSSRTIRIVASCYSGVNPGQPDSFAQTNGVTTPRTLTTTVVASDCWLGMVAYDNSGSLSAGAGTTERADDGFLAIYDSNGTVSTGSQSLVYNNNNGDNDGGVIISFDPIGGGSTFIPRIMVY